MATEARAEENINREIVWGNPTNEILRYAEKGDYDLIVMATHGRTGINRLLLGSVAEQVIRHSVCPVFVVRSPES